MLERILLTAAHWPGGARDVTVKFGRVRNHDHAETLEYFAYKRLRDRWLPWHLLQDPIQFVPASARALGMQVADAYAGVLSTALNPHELGIFEHYHLLDVGHQVRRAPNGSPLGYGLKGFTAPGSLEAMPWWQPLMGQAQRGA